MILDISIVFVGPFVPDLLDCVLPYLLNMDLSAGAVCSAGCSYSDVVRIKWSTTGVQGLDGEAIEVSEYYVFVYIRCYTILTMM